jgi:WS/DGAT/MGAT family acyltransferase
MSRLTPIDLAFLLLENPTRQVHMAAFQIFRIPAKQRKTFIPRLLDVYRSGDVGKPFNQKLKWLDKGVASWEAAEPDLKYHVRHIAVPAPGRMEEFYDIVSFLNSSLLDRSKPLWECYVIEGLPDDQFAVLTKVHHALIDGGGALKLFRNSLNTSAKDRSMRAAWSPLEETSRRPRSRSDKTQLDKLMKRAGSLPSSLFNMGMGLADLSAQNLRLKPRKASLPFGAKKTPFNQTPGSSERRYANCELPLDTIKAISKATDTTVNDVVMTLIDDALNRYLEEHGNAAGEPLVTMMAMSFRSEEHGEAGNQVSIELVPMGEPSAPLADRLQQIHRSTESIKENSSAIPTSVRQLYSLVIFGSGTLPEFSKAFQSIPNANLLISNMIGPREQLYLGGAPLVAFHGLPIVPPGCGLNVTFATINQDICLGVGAAPEAVDDPYHVTRLILEALHDLEKTVLPGKKSRKAPTGKARPKKPGAAKSTARKTTPRKKTGARKAAPKRVAKARGKRS